MKSQHIIIISFVLFCAPFISAQVVLLDQVVETENYKLYPAATNPNDYYYLPDKVRLGLHPDGSIQASFLRYTQEVETTDEGDGGGLFHALVELYNDPSELAEAERQMKRVNSDAVLKGPVSYESGTISLVSSFQADNGDFVKRVIGLGNAPLLTGQKASFSIQLTKEGGQVLERSLQTNTPDLSVKFEMIVKGYNSPKKIKINANWEQIYKHETMAAAIVTPTFSMDILTAFEDLEKSGAIKVEQFGDDEGLEKAKDYAYERLLSMMFEPSNGTGVPSLEQLTTLGDSKESMIDRASKMLSDARKEAREDFDKYDRSKVISFITVPPGKGNEKYNAVNRYLTAYYAENPDELVEELSNSEEPDLPSMAIAASFHLKKSRRSGNYTIDLNKYAEGTRSHRFDYNVGPQVKNCDECMTRTFLDKFMHQQRKIAVTINGIQADDFKNHLNYVSVEMVKEHESGDKSVDELGIDLNKFNEKGNSFEVQYGWKNDLDQEKWKKYKYRTTWNFHGGHNIQSEWVTNETNAIPLSPPLIKRDVSVEGNIDFFRDKNIRTVVVRVSNENTPEIEVRLRLNEDLVFDQVTLLCTDLSENYSYEVFWYFNDGSTRSSGKRTSNFPFVALDNESLLN